MTPCCCVLRTDMIGPANALSSMKSVLATPSILSSSGRLTASRSQACNITMEILLVCLQRLCACTAHSMLCSQRWCASEPAAASMPGVRTINAWSAAVRLRRPSRSAAEPSTLSAAELPLAATLTRTVVMLMWLSWAERLQNRAAVAAEVQITSQC